MTLHFITYLDNVQKVIYNIFMSCTSLIIIPSWGPNIKWVNDWISLYWNSIVFKELIDKFKIKVSINFIYVKSLYGIIIFLTFLINFSWRFLLSLYKIIKFLTTKLFNQNKLTSRQTKHLIKLIHIYRQTEKRRENQIKKNNLPN